MSTWSSLHDGLTGKDIHDRADATEELLADFTGDALSDPEFLQRLADDNPGKFKALLTAVKQWLNRLIGKLYNNGPEEFITDVKALREHLANVLQVYASGGDIAAEVGSVKFSQTKNPLLAPNGKPSKLNERQWHQVRTPEFKAWFGDWEVHANNKVVNDQLQAWSNGELKASTILQIGNPGSILRQHGIPDLPIHLTQSVISKAVDKKHEVDVADLQDLVVNIHAPLAIFKSKSGDGRLAIVTEMRHADGNLLVALDIEVTRDGLSINDIRSVHPKRDSSISHWINEGRLVGLEKHKGRDWLESLAATNMQQPQVNTTFDESILYDADSIRNTSKVVDPETGEPMVVIMVLTLNSVRSTWIKPRTVPISSLQTNPMQRVLALLVITMSA